MALQRALRRGAESSDQEGDIRKCITRIYKLLWEGEYYDMTTLFEQLIAKNAKTISFPLSDYWLDIGLIELFDQEKF